MELELGFKITQTRDDVTSTSNLSIAKDRAGPVFVSRETDTMFILAAHLKGFGRDNVGIKINEDGSRITISGKRAVQEIVMRGWAVYKKDVEMRGFSKAFRIPDGVVLDKIKAKFSDDDSVLTVSMPKLVKGIRGLGIEEVKEGQEPDTAQDVAADKLLQDDVKKVAEEEALVINNRVEETADKESEEQPDHGAQEEDKEEVSQEKIGGYVPEREQPGKQELEEGHDRAEEMLQEALETEKQNQLEDPKQEEAAQLPPTEEKAKGDGQESGDPTQAVEDHVPDPAPGDHCEGESEMQKGVENQEPTSDAQEPTKEQEPNQKETPTPVINPPADEHKDDETRCAEDESEEEEEEEENDGSEGSETDKGAAEVEKHKSEDEGERGKKKKRCKLGVPIMIAGSAILVSLFVYVVHSIRTKKRS